MERFASPVEDNQAPLPATRVPPKKWITVGRHWCPVACLLLATVVLRLAMLRTPVDFFDEGFIIEYPLLLRVGELPFASYATEYPVTWFAILGAVFQAFPVAVLLTVERLVSLFLAILTSGALYKAFRLPPRRTRAAIAVLAVVFWLSYPSPWLAGLAFAVVGTVICSRSASLKAFALGMILLGVGGSCTLQLFPFAFIASLLLCRTQWRDWRWTLSYSGALPWVVGNALWLWNLARVGVGNIVPQVIVSVLDTRSGRSLPLTPVPDDVFPFLLVIAATVVSVVPLLGAIPRLRPDLPEPLLRPEALCLSLIALAACGQFLERDDITHACDALSILAPYGAYVAVSLFRNSPRSAAGDRRNHSRTSLVSTGYMCVLIAVAATQVGAQDLSAARGSRAWVCSSRGVCMLMAVNPQERATSALVSALRRVPLTETLFVGPPNLREAYIDDAYLYPLLYPRLPCTSYIELNPGQANAPKSKLASQLQHCSVVILCADTPVSHEHNTSGELGPETPNVVVRQDFTLNSRIDDDFFVYLRKPATDLSEKP